MGTNYYLMQQAACPHCGHVPEKLHIGKSSGGWTFALHVYPGEVGKPQNLSDWQALFRAGKIFNEYDREVSADLTPFMNKISAYEAFSGIAVG